MIILGIDPGTATMGYGIVERRGGSLRAVDYGALTTSAVLLVQAHYSMRSGAGTREEVEN